MIDYRDILDNIPDAYSIIKVNPPKYTMVFANKAHLENVGMTSEEFLGRGMFEMFPDNLDGTSQKLVLGAMEKAVETKTVQTPPMLRYDLPGGEVRYWSLKYMPILDIDGDVGYLIQSATDITQIVNRGIKLPLL